MNLSRPRPASFSKKTKRFTVLVVAQPDGIANTGGLPTLQPSALELRAYRVSQVVQKKTDLEISERRLPRIDAYWGKEIQTALQSKGVKASFIPIDKLSFSSFEDQPLKLQWLKTLQVDTIVVVNQRKLLLDHSTRLPDSAVMSVMATLFLWADVWWIDGLGRWFLENEVEISFVRVSDGTSIGKASGLYARKALGVFLYSNLDEDLVLSAIEETNRTNAETFRKSL